MNSLKATSHAGTLETLSLLSAIISIASIIIPIRNSSPHIAGLPII